MATVRPSLTFSRTRAAIARAAEEDDGTNSLSSAMSFKRRYPRLGNSFQTRVPKSVLSTGYSTNRPRPVLLSSQVPYATKEEAKQELVVSIDNPGRDMTATDGSLPSLSLETTSGTALRKFCVGKILPIAPPDINNLMGNDQTTTSNNHEENLHAATSPDLEWTSALLKWHQAHEKSLEPIPRHGRVSRFKRRREVPSLPQLPGRPNKVRALLFSTNNNNENGPIPVEQAEWRLLVDLQAGQACKRIREVRKRGPAHLSLKTSSSNNSSNSEPLWRRLDPEPVVRLHGNYPQTSALTPHQTAPSNLNPHSQQKDTWKAVLICAKEYQKQIQSSSSSKSSNNGTNNGGGDGLVLLSTLTRFWEQCCRLLPPEQVLVADGETVLVRELDTTLDLLVNAIFKARQLRAEWMDLWYKPGVDLETLRKSLKKVDGIPQPDEWAELSRQIQVVADWQVQVDAVRTSPRSSQNDLVELEELHKIAKSTHAFCSKGLVALETRLEKAYELRGRILQWKQTIEQHKEESTRTASMEDGEAKTPVPLENIKFLSALVREITRLKVKFPAATFALEVSETMDAWVERANVAIRSRISLKEIRSLIQKGLEIPIDLTEYLDKLKMRESKAQEWLDHLNEYVAVPETFEHASLLGWMKLVRSKLDQEGGVVSDIHDLACEGSRIPVELDCVHLLQIELDARNWSTKARMIVDADSSSKKTRLEDIREHMEKAASLRSRLILSADEKDKWELECENELGSLVKQVDQWFEEYEELLENEEGSRAQVSMKDLKDIVGKANAIYVNLGAASVKMSKILSQAEKWFSRHDALLAKSRPQQGNENTKVVISELKEAVEDAEENIGCLDLTEVVEFQVLMERIEGWTERVAAAVEGKKIRGKQKLVFTVEDIKTLIEEGKNLPIETTDSTAQLEAVICSVNDWTTEAAKAISEVSVGFIELKKTIDDKYGKPSIFSPGQIEVGESISKAESSSFPEEKKQPEELFLLDDGIDHELDPRGFDPIDNLTLGWVTEKLIRKMSQEAKMSCMVTEEGNVAMQLEDLARWTARSLKYLENPKEIYDSRFFGSFDRFLAEGKSLVDGALILQEDSSSEASMCWRDLVQDQLERMHVLLKERAEFVSWCKQAQEIISGNDKRLPVEKLREVLKRSSRFPADNDLVFRIKQLTDKCESWISMASSALESEDKLPLHEAKTLVEEGNRLGIQSNELRALRGGVKAARSWANKVKKNNADQGQVHVTAVKALIDEYNDLIVTLPEEFKRLSHCMKNYCICRRPYDGFMIKCEKCDDYFHGACVGVSQARAEKKADKYVCVRCLVAKVFHSSTTSIAGILRKWTNDADLRKARMSNAQRHQRKIKKETKELEKLRSVAGEITQALAKQAAAALVAAPVPPVSSTVHELVVPDQQLKEQQKQHQQQSVGPITEQPAAVPKIDTVQKSGEGASVETPETSAATGFDDAVKAPLPDTKPETPQELAQKIEKVSAAIKQCQTKLQDLADAAVQLRNEEEIENMKVDVLKKWCIRVRSLVLAPSNEQQALNSRPLASGSMSPPMLSMLKEAEKHGLMRFADIKLVANAFKCLCWSSQAMDILAKQPKASEAVMAVRQASSLKLPDEKGLRMIKAMAQRATAWNFKASRLLMPAPGEKRPYDMKELKNLADLADDIPLRMPLETRVQAVIEDEGNRHCVCGGPSDGRLMLNCDKCEKWFHAHCVGIQKEEDLEDEWKCPPCRGVLLSVPQDLLRGFHDAFGQVEEDESSADSDDDTASTAPRTEKLWPPFGLLGSSKSVESLGQKLCSFPDDLGTWDKKPPQAPLAKNVPATTANVQATWTHGNCTLGNGSNGLKRPPFAGDGAPVVAVVTKCDPSLILPTSGPPNPVQDRRIIMSDSAVPVLAPVVVGDHNAARSVIERESGGVVDDDNDEESKQEKEPSPESFHVHRSEKDEEKGEKRKKNDNDNDEESNQETESSSEPVDLHRSMLDYGFEFGSSSEE